MCGPSRGREAAKINPEPWRAGLGNQHVSLQWRCVPSKASSAAACTLGELKGPHLPSSGSGSPLVTRTSDQEGISGGSAFDISVPGSKNHTLVLLCPEGQGGDALRGQGGDKSGVSTVASLRTRLSHSPLSVVTSS